MILSPIDTAIILAYFVTMLGIGFFVMRRASKNLDSYFLADSTLDDTRL